MRPNLAPPPRELSLFNRLVILFGGFHAQFGWFFFGFGMIFFWIFFMNSEAIRWGKNISKQEGIATVTRIDTTSREGDYTFYYQNLQYEVAGEVYTAEKVDLDPPYHVGQEVPILFEPENPAKYALADEQAIFGWEVSAVLIFPLVGIIFIFLGWRRNQKAVDLLKYGHMAMGKFIDKTATGTEINKIPEYRYTFQFVAEDRQTYTVQGSTHLHHLMEEEEEERLLYLTKDPNFAYLYDLIPNAPKIAANGRFQSAHWSRGIVLLVPILSLLVHGSIAFAWYRLASLLS